MNKIILLLLILTASCAKNSAYRREIDKEALKICFIGDTGTKKPVQYRVAEMLAGENCDTVHFVGDIIYPNGITSKYDKAFKEKFLDVYAPIMKDTPVYLIMGNHDHRSSIEPWIEAAKDIKNLHFPYPYYFLKMKDVCLVHLDSNYYKVLSNFFVAQVQANWLAKMQEEVDKCGVKIALTHHPYKSSGKRHGNSTGWWKNFAESFIIGKYDYFISGHEHILSDEGVKEGTRMLISGAGGNTEEFNEGGYLVLEFSKGKVDYYFRQIGSTK